MEKVELSKNPEKNLALFTVAIKHLRGVSEVERILNPPFISPLIMERLAYIETAAQDFLQPSS